MEEEIIRLQKREDCEGCKYTKVDLNNWPCSRCMVWYKMTFPQEAK